MASLLLRLKTRMLLPRQQDEEGLDIDDPRVNLIDQLLQYKNFKNIAYQLKEMICFIVRMIGLFLKKCLVLQTF